MSNTSLPSGPENIFSLDGCSVLVTGAASGIGASTAEVLAAQGARVILADINQQGLEEQSSKLAQKYSVHSVVLDQADKSSVLNAADSALAWAGTIDTLVCSGGIEGHVGTLQNISDADWNAVMTINLQSSLWLSNALIPQMIENSKGRLIYVASIAALRGNSAIGSYGIAKAGLSQLARNFAVEFGRYGITANAIAPGLINTPFAQELMKDEKFMQKRMALTPLRRVGEPHEVAGVIAMLASSAGGFINGQTLTVDGGTVITDGS
jgi:NAD(P)-dependent dehydrogenase (short-subunit alcohol dehydrogenase family)